MNKIFQLHGIDVKMDQEGRYSLEDLHFVSGSEKRYKPSTWLRENAKELIAGLLQPGPRPVMVYTTGENRGTYASKEYASDYLCWVDPELFVDFLYAFMGE
jgi:hypothetical protein